MISWEDKIYPHLPVIGQNLACSIHGLRQRRLRYGGQFHELLDWLEETQWWSHDQILAYQTEQLQKIIHHAYSTVPYYRKAFDRRGLKPKNIQTLTDLSKLPILTKEDIRNNLRSLISNKYSPRELILSHTSGTSGKALQFYMELRSFQFRWAVWWRHKKRFGVEFDAPYATFTGLNAIPIEQEKPPFWRENYILHQTVFTMHHITPDKVKAIVNRLNQGGFVYYSGYPSIISVLANLIQEKDLKITAPPKIIFTGAEALYDYQRQLIEEVFQCPVTDQYGFSEGCGNASKCGNDVYHEDFEYGVLECIDPEPIGNGLMKGKILATGFSNYGMPFIRYEVGDIGVWRQLACQCGRHSKVLTRIVGRIEDYVITPEGARIMRFDYIFKDTSNVKEAQVIQQKRGEIILKIVQRPSYSSRDEKFIRTEIKEKISPNLRVKFEYTDEIEREPNGKFQAVKSLLLHETTPAKF